MTAAAPWMLATWNVNSIRMREEAVREWLATHSPDVLAMQETKTVEDGFPAAAFESLGYTSFVFGQKTWNGVAFLCRGEMGEIRRGLPEMEGDESARMVSARFGETTIINVYVPNGQTVTSEKYPYKLRWLEALQRHLETRYRPDQPLAIVGDFNIAPDERDIHDPAGYKDQVLFSGPERAAVRRLADWGLIDLFRRHHEEAGLYSWWDYRMGAFRRNMGARLDLVLVTAPLAARAVSCEIDKNPRKRAKPSDHTPVIAAFGS